MKENSNKKLKAMKEAVMLGLITKKEYQKLKKNDDKDL